MAGKFLVQSGVDAPGGEKRLMRAALDDAAFVHDEDERRLADGGETVRDDKSRPALQEDVERSLNEGLAFRIDRAGGFIQN